MTRFDADITGDLLAELDRDLATGKVTRMEAIKKAFSLGAKFGQERTLERFAERAAHIPTSENP